MRRFRDIGFTLIELIVVIAITIILSGMSLAAYFRFSQRQAALNDARNFATELKKVQAMAKNLVYPSTCSSRLERYRLKSVCFVEGCTAVNVDAFCDGSPISVKTNEEVLMKSYFSEEVDISFAAGTGTVSPVASFPLTNSEDGYTVVVSIDQIGNISTKEYEIYPPEN